MKKLVSESVEDILKPKTVDPEDLNKYLERAIGRAEFIADDMDVAVEMQNLQQFRMAYAHIDGWFYDLPDWIQNRSEIEEVYAALQAKYDDLYEKHFLSESFILEGKKELALAAGLVIIQDGKILLAHPTNAKWVGTFSIPKGHVEEGEELIDAAIRETREEVGIKIDKDEIVDGPHFVDYVDNKGKLYKRVYYYVVRPSKKIKPGKLQKAEVDWAGFMSKADAKKRILGKLRSVLKHVK